MRFRVDSELCQGHNRCAAVAPDLFDLDDHGFATAANGGVVPDDREEDVELAVDNCPELAVILEGDSA